MNKTTNDTMYITCTSRGYLAALKTMGPIITPLEVSKDVARVLVTSGAKVQKYDPKTKKSEVLTLASFCKSQEDMVEEAVYTKTPETTEFGVVMDAEKDKTSLDSFIGEKDHPTPDSTEVADLLKEGNLSHVKLELNTDGKVNESKIDWKALTKEERKTLRKAIDLTNEKSKVAE